MGSQSVDEWQYIYLNVLIVILAVFFIGVQIGGIDVFDSDKVKHISISIILVLVCYNFCGLSIGSSVAAAFGIGFSKEVLDNYHLVVGSGFFDVRDLEADIVGIALGIALIFSSVVSKNIKSEGV